LRVNEIDDRIVILVLVILIAIISFIGAFVKLFELSEAFSIGSVGIAALALYYTRKVRGPDFVLTEARVTDRTNETATVVVLIQNIGDRMGYLRWDTTYLKVKSKIFNLRAAREYNTTFASDTQQEKGGFTFLAGEDEDLTFGFFIAIGVYSSHEGGLKEKVWETPLKGSLSPK